MPVKGMEHSSTHAVADTAQQNADADMSAAAPLPTASAGAAKKQTTHTAAQSQKQTAAKKLTAQQLAQPQLLHGARYDCQGLRLLPGDALLHSEALAAHRQQTGSSSTRPAGAPIQYLDVTVTVDDLCKRDQDCSVSDRPYMGNDNSGCKEGPATDQGGYFLHLVSESSLSTSAATCCCHADTLNCKCHVWIFSIVYEKSAMLQDATDGSQHHIIAAFSLLYRVEQALPPVHVSVSYTQVSYTFCGH